MSEGLTSSGEEVDYKHFSVKADIVIFIWKQSQILSDTNEGL